MVTSFDAPLGTAGSLNSWRVNAFSILAPELTRLGMEVPEIVPVTSTDWGALIVMLPAEPVAAVEESTLPPSLTSNLGVLIVKFPPFPGPSVDTPTRLEVNWVGSAPMTSTESVALTVTSPPSPVPKVPAPTRPPFATVSLPVKMLTFPDFPEPMAEEPIKLSAFGLVAKDPISCTDSEAFTVTLPPFAFVKVAVDIPAPPCTTNCWVEIVMSPPLVAPRVKGEKKENCPPLNVPPNSDVMAPPVSRKTELAVTFTFPEAPAP